MHLNSYKNYNFILLNFQQRHVRILRGDKMKEILREIGMITRAFGVICDIDYKEIKLGKGHHLYLSRIYENPGMVSETIAQILKVDRTTTFKIIKKLCEAGLVEKRRDPDNKKNWHLFCTKKGEEYYKFIISREEFYTEESLKTLSKEEKDILHHLLNKVRKNVETIWEDTKKR